MNNSALLLPTLAGAVYPSSALPTVNADSTQGFSVGSSWLYTGAFPAPELLVCTDATAGAAVWMFARTMKTLGVCSAPVGIAPSGSFANNGAWTSGTALAASFTFGYLYFPAGAIAASGAGSAAGNYYVVMSDTTHGTVYNNTYTTGDSVFLASPTAFTTTGPGAYTQTTGTYFLGFNLTLPGGAVGPRDDVLLEAIFEYPNNANNKSVRFQISGSLITSSNATTTASVRASALLMGRGQSKQIMGCSNIFSPYSLVSSSPATSTFDMTQQQIPGFGLNIANAADYIIISAGYMNLIRATS